MQEFLLQCVPSCFQQPIIVHRPRLRRGLMFALILLSIPLTSTAYSSFVHREICASALHLVDMKTRSHIQVLSARRFYRKNVIRRFLENKNADFGFACQWPDIVKRNDKRKHFKATHAATAPLHYINIKRKYKKFNPARDCMDDKCTTQAIARYIRQFNAEADLGKKSEALRFIGHFVADLHQPLHVGYQADKGGNTIKVFWRMGKKTRSLHTVWDRTIPGELQLTRQAILESLGSDLHQWQRGSYDEWANESFQLAQRVAYVHAHNTIIKSGDRLHKPYYDHAKVHAKHQILKATARLAKILSRLNYAPLDIP